MVAKTHTKKHYLKENLDAQILVITLMVLLMLSIIVIGIAAVVTRDTSQTVNQQQYETSYNKTEEKMLNILDSYGDTSVSLSGLLTSEGCPAQGSIYKCSYTDNNLNTQVTVQDTNVVSNYELGKDKTFKVILGTYTGSLDISWTGETAILMELEYKDTNGAYKAVQDVYDNSGILTSGGTAADHPFNYTVPSGKSNTISFTVSGITTPTTVSTRYYIKIKALMREDSHISTLLSVVGSTSGGAGGMLPNQIRQFEGVSYYKSDTTFSSSAPTLITQIPLAGSDPELLNYVLRSNTSVNK